MSSHGAALSIPCSVRLRNVRKHFGSVRAIDGVDLDVSPGEFIVFLGPSGCGKSTLLRLVAGLERPTSGEIWIGEDEVTGLSPGDRDVAMVFQNYALYSHMSVAANLAFGLAVRDTPKREINARVQAVAAALSLGDVLERKPTELSGGQRQRVAMGRAMARQPRLFLMDEPLSSLDTQLRGAMRGELARLRQRLSTTTLYVTHDQVEAMTLGDRIAVLRAGRVEQCDTPQNTFSNPVNLFVASFIGAPAMNFFVACVESGLVRLGEAVIPVANPALEGSTVIAGIRPNAFQSDGVADATFPRLGVTCEVVEELGNESYVIFQLPVAPLDARLSRHVAGAARDIQLLAPDPDKTTFTGRVTLTPQTRAGQRVRLAVNPERLYLFDPDTGAALPRGEVRQPAPPASSAIMVPERIQTDRLLLRRWAEDDRHAMVALWRDPAVWRSLQPDLPFDPHRGEREFQGQLDHWGEHGFGLWAIVERRSGQTIGWTGPTHPYFVPELAHEVEFGWTLRRELWGRGFATEAARAGLAEVFSVAPWPHVISIIRPENERSAAVARRLGMNRERDVQDPSIGARVGVWKLRRADWRASSAEIARARERSLG
jgi:multiple sugar transport system ATP-binding protein